MPCFSVGCQMVKTKTSSEIGQNQMVQTQEIHCPACGRFLGYQAIVLGLIKLLCPNCKEWVIIDVLPHK